MNTYTRNNFKWGVREILSLQREFQLLNLSIEEIAKKHKRTPNAIMLKLDKESMADYNVLYTNYYGSKNFTSDEIKLENEADDEEEADDDEDYEGYEDNDDEDYEEEAEADDEEEEADDEEEEEADNEDDEDYEVLDDDEYDDPLIKRVSKIETDIKEIITMLKELLSKKN
jgi:hypothetical protein